MSDIKLPALILGPIRYPIGEACQLLRNASKHSIISTRDVKIGPRTSEPCIKLDNGENIILTERRKVKLPVGVHGVLRKMSDGSFQWITHRRLQKKYKEIKKNGLKSIADAASETWFGSFSYRAEQLDETGIPIPGHSGLRPPQLAALFAIGAHWSLNSQPATIVMPTGTGKTETMLSTLAAHQCSPLVVAVPSTALRDQTANKFITFGLLRSLKVLAETADNPVVGIVKNRPKSAEDLKLFEDCNVVVGTMSSLSGGDAGVLGPQIAGRSRTLVLDEAHHVTAATWALLRKSFANKQVLQFTATPFRRDGKLVDGNIISSYSLKAAQDDGYFKPITFSPVHELSRERADIAIAKRAIEQLNDDISNGNSHLVMARCSSIQRAESIQKIYQSFAPEFQPVVIHSELKDSADRVLELREHRSKIVICVDMLGEGFDLPELKIAAVHDSHKSLSVLLQFTGRFTRSSGDKIGDATMIANIADPDISLALERLYGEDSDWNSLLSELSSDAAKDHAELIKFLNDSGVVGDDDLDSESISHSLLHPKLSTLFFHARSFHPKKFHAGLPVNLEIARVWINDSSNTLFFVTRSTEKVNWSRSKELVETGWDLFILQYDQKRKLLYLNSSEKSSHFQKLAEAVGAESQVSGEQIFRCLGRIGRLVFQNLGVSKHGRRNLSYAMYTGADVRQALSLSEKAGSRKSNLSGTGWEDGKQISVGCSYKGRVWAKQSGTIPEFVRWAKGIGDKLVDDTIRTEEIIDNVLIPDEVKTLPDGTIMGIEWPAELLRYSEDKVSLSRESESDPFFLFDLKYQGVKKDDNEIFFNIVSTNGDTWGEYCLRIGGAPGFVVFPTGSQSIALEIGRNSTPLDQFFCDYPPLIRYVDLSELDGNLILRPQNPQELELHGDRFEVWNWAGVDKKKESLWKNDAIRKDSIQWAAAQKFIDGGYELVFDDDGPGEAADLVCMQEESDHIKLVLVHCKYSGGTQAGVRIADVVEVASQAVRSAKWPGRFRDLCKHILNRNERRRTSTRQSHILAGTASDITRISRSARFKEVRTQVLIVQPGVSQAKLTDDQSQVLAAAVTYLQQTVGVDLDIVCSE